MILKNQNIHFFKDIKQEKKKKKKDFLHLGSYSEIWLKHLISQIAAGKFSVNFINGLIVSAFPLILSANDTEYCHAALLLMYG